MPREAVGIEAAMAEAGAAVWADGAQGIPLRGALDREAALATGTATGPVAVTGAVEDTGDEATGIAT